MNNLLKMLRKHGDTDIVEVTNTTIRNDSQEGDCSVCFFCGPR